MNKSSGTGKPVLEVVGFVVGFCAILTLHSWLRSLAQAYAASTYQTAPVYGVWIAASFAYAAMGRIALAWYRRERFRGRLALHIPSLAGFLVFVVFGILAMALRQHALVLNGLFLPAALFSLLCLLQRTE